MAERKGAAGTELVFIEPMQPGLVDQPPEGDRWLHEVKFDGYRTQTLVENGVARLFTRRGHDWSARYATVTAAAAALPCRAAIIDGEMVVLDSTGRVSFRALRSAITQAPDRLALVAFDLLHLDGDDLRDRPLFERRQLLWRLIQPAQGAIQFSDELPGGGGAVYAAVDAMGLEGMVSKERTSLYRSGPTLAWRKTKCFDTAEFDIVGVERDRGKVPLVLLAQNGKFVGAVTIGPSRRVRERLWARVEAKRAPPPSPRLARTQPTAEWVGPGLVASVRIMKGEETLRHASMTEFHERDGGDG